MKKSVWQDSAALPQFDSLHGDKKTDVLIIGGGIAGLLCAYFLSRRGVDYILAEGSTIASGITKNTTAKLTFQHGLILSKLIEHAGFEKAQMYLKANVDALNEYTVLCKDISCGYENKSAYTYTLQDPQRVIAEVKAANSLGIDADFVSTTELPFDTKGAILFKKQAQFNPIQFISAIAKGLDIYENTFIHTLTQNTALSDKGKICFKKVIVCTHFPFINKHGSYFVKLYQHRSYVSAYENAHQLDGMYVDEDLKGMSFRSYGNLLLIGGGSHRTGKNGGSWQEIETFANTHYPKAKLTHQWATQDCMTLDGIPYAGHYSKRTPNMYVATGFNKWGMTNAMACAKILCDMVCEKQNDLAEVFSPQRSMVKPQLFVNGFEAVANLVTPSAKRCPHLGCALKWNKHEHTWDCPCHGSRFENDGKLIDNPSTGDANV